MNKIELLFEPEFTTERYNSNLQMSKEKYLKNLLSDSVKFPLEKNKNSVIKTNQHWHQQLGGMCFITQQFLFSWQNFVAEI